MCKTWSWEAGVLAGYYFLILVETVLLRKPYEGQHFQPEMFWSWKIWNKQKEQIIINIMMFVPIGFLISRMWKWKGLLVALGFSLAIELLQLITARGLCEFDDLFHNMLGASISTAVMMIMERIRINRQHKEERDTVE